MKKTLPNGGAVTALSVQELAAALRSREISAVETAEAYLDRILENDGDIHAYITVTESLCATR
jgi:aspartyl-tRNA(Asn)/glutamyl-tRNA(Gln) amidotransferase subunit A